MRDFIKNVSNIHSPTLINLCTITRRFLRLYIPFRIAVGLSCIFLFFQPRCKPSHFSALNVICHLFAIASACPYLLSLKTALNFSKFVSFSKSENVPRISTYKLLRTIDDLEPCTQLHFTLFVCLKINLSLLLSVSCS